jgi:hypothetical protein
VPVVETEGDTTHAKPNGKEDRNALRHQRIVYTNLLFKMECGIYSTLALTWVCCGNHVDIFVNVFPTSATALPILLSLFLLFPCKG